MQSGFNTKRFLIVVSVLFLISYGVFNARKLIMGPTIEVFRPAKDMVTGERILPVEGRVKNVAFISLNERPIFIDPEGLFKEKLLLSPGSNIIEIKIRDRFKKEVLEIIRVYYKQSATNENEADQQIKI